MNRPRDRLWPTPIRRIGRGTLDGMADEADGRIGFEDNAQAGRFELHLDGRLVGLADYVVRGSELVIPHTEVDPAYGGRGLGSQLARFALDRTRERGLTVVPACPFIATYIRRHPEYADLLGRSAG